MRRVGGDCIEKFKVLGLIVTLNKKNGKKGPKEPFFAIPFYLYFPKEECGYRSETSFLFILQQYEEIENGS
jgi:hypothetical protein